jgi:uncharacterized protein YozE (UPF0346 family)
MAIDISSIAFAITHDPKVSTRIKHGHAQQCLAAALGYKSLAALQASPDASFLPDRETHVVLDGATLLVRSRELGMAVGGEELCVLLRGAISNAWVGTPVHMSLDEFRNSLQQDVDLTTANDGIVSGQTAITNSDGIREIYMPIEGLDFDSVPPNGDPHELEISGHIAMQHDRERPYWGHRVDVHAMLWLVRQGRAFWAAGCRIRDADLDTNWNQPEILTLAEAMADLLDVDISDAEELTDAPLLQLASEDGLVYGWEFDFGEVEVAEDVLDHIRARHGSLHVRVGPDFFDLVQEFDRNPRRHYLHGDEIEDEPEVYFCASCDFPVGADHFDREHAAKSYERYFADLHRWRHRPARTMGSVRRPTNAVNVVAAAALANQAAFEASRSPFHQWLGEQVQRNDPIGDFARDVRRDKAFPVSALSREAVLRYLETAVRAPDAMVAFKEAWTEFNGTR